jgi:hypothetical protein
MTDPASEIQFQSNDYPDESLSITRPEIDSSGFCRMPVTINAHGLRCAHEVLMSGSDGLPDFIANLAKDWQGWTGTRAWEAVEQTLTIEATHTGRRIELVFTLRRDIDVDAWHVTIPMSIAPDESLKRLAESAEELFRNA